jgi:hypothetical protein
MTPGGWSACMQKKTKLMSHMQHWLILKKSMNHKTNTKIKFPSHHWISDNKNFETRPHLTIFLTKIILFVFFNYG